MSTVMHVSSYTLKGNTKTITTLMYKGGFRLMVEADIKSKLW